MTQQSDSRLFAIVPSFCFFERELIKKHSASNIWASLKKQIRYGIDVDERHSFDNIKFCSYYSYMYKAAYPEWHAGTLLKLMGSAKWINEINPSQIEMYELCELENTNDQISAILKILDIINLFYKNRNLPYYNIEKLIVVGVDGVDNNLIELLTPSIKKRNNNKSNIVIDIHIFSS